MSKTDSPYSQGVLLAETDNYITTQMSCYNYIMRQGKERGSVGAQVPDIDQGV